MMRIFRILFTGAGRSVEFLRAFRPAVNHLSTLRFAEQILLELLLS